MISSIIMQKHQVSLAYHSYWMSVWSSELGYCCCWGCSHGVQYTAGLHRTKAQNGIGPSVEPNDGIAYTYSRYKTKGGPPAPTKHHSSHRTLRLITHQVLEHRIHDIGSFAVFYGEKSQVRTRNWTIRPDMLPPSIPAKVGQRSVKWFKVNRYEI